MKTFVFGLLLAVSFVHAKPTERVVGGQDAIVHEFPYQVSLQYVDPETGDSIHFCGGTLLSERHVLTAAHCRQSDEDLPHVVVIAGAHNFKNRTGFEQTSHITKFVNHEKFTGGVAPHDIAVIQLTTPFKLTEKVKPAALPAKDYHASGLATLSGWGYISKGYENVRPDQLQKADLFIYFDKDCHKFWFPSVYDDTNVCAGFGKGVPTACKGDSGGPLAQSLNEKTVVVGVVSWGYYPCGKKNKPTVFAEVSHYVDWIEKQMKAL